MLQCPHGGPHVCLAPGPQKVNPALPGCCLGQPGVLSREFLLSALLAQGQYDLEGPPYLDQLQYSQYDPQLDATQRTPEEQFQYQSQQQTQQEIIPAPTPGASGNCREEQYPCTRLYSVHKPCKQCLNEICFYSLRRVYVINKEICVRTVCAHEELLRADLCRDKFSKCGVLATSGLCQTVATSCARSCGGC
uniref:Microfibril associated protein 2 n=1 Tax=Terrapene triunguis TaxID=2587831 RepID=A0A674KFC9_9SAUR